MVMPKVRLTQECKGLISGNLDPSLTFMFFLAFAAIPNVFSGPLTDLHVFITLVDHQLVVKVVVCDIKGTINFVTVLGHG